MREQSDKRRIYWLIDEYLSGCINERDFCDEYYFSYNMAVDHKNLTKLEKINFKKISDIASRFSEFEEDHALDLNAFAGVQELQEKILEAKAKLNFIKCDE